MPIITKPSGALKLALNVIQMDTAPWAGYNTKRGANTYTCNALDYLVEAEEITEEAKEAALEALFAQSPLARRYINHKGLATVSWFIGTDGFDSPSLRIAAIQQTITELEASHG